jgi:hypothetical protein
MRKKKSLAQIAFTIITIILLLSMLLGLFVMVLPYRG